jgi:hypothetical protein
MPHGVTVWTYLVGLVTSAIVIVPLLLMLWTNKRHPDDE